MSVNSDEDDSGSDSEMEVDLLQVSVSGRLCKNEVKHAEK